MKSLSIIFFTCIAQAAPQINCFDTAKRNHDLLDNAAIRLCKGAKSNIPVQCFDNSSDKGLSLYDRISLCTGAEDLSPLECYDISKMKNINPEQAIVLCSSHQ